jgi:hypothetical protein
MRLTGTVLVDSVRIFFLNNSFIERLQIRLVFYLTTSVVKYFNLVHFDKQSATGIFDGQEGPAATPAPRRFIK